MRERLKMELWEAIKKRRSVRQFQNRPVDQGLIIKVIEAGMWAPSACNLQNWKFIVIDNQNLKEKLVDWGAAIFIKHAPMAILVLYDNRTANIEYQDHIQSAAAAIQNMLLAAISLELGTCWICQLPTKGRLRKLLKIPSTYDPIACIVIGYPAKEAKAVNRKGDMEAMVSWNEFSGKSAEVNLLKVFIKRILLGIYYFLPVRVKKGINNFIDAHFVKKFPE